MTGRILMALAGALLLAFLLAPAGFAPLFQPFTRNDAPAIRRRHSWPVSSSILSLP